MSYESDFYRPENIIGYTGDINLDPTVYFKDPPDGIPPQRVKYGHITQEHRLGKIVAASGEVLSEGANVGREKVHFSQHYHMEDGPGHHLQEWDDERSDQPVHTSRNQFIPKAGLDARAMYLLSCAIARFTEEKEWSHYTAEEQAELKHAPQGKGYFAALRR